MAILNGTTLADILRGFSVSDSLFGGGGNDLLRGLGGDDLVSGGDGDDILEGDGVSTVSDAVRETGSATVAYAGTVSSKSGLLLTAMGQVVSADGTTDSVWRIRNATDQPMTVVLQSASQGMESVSYTVTVPPHSDTFITSDNLSTHKLMLDGKQVDVKAASGKEFVYDAPHGQTIDGNDVLDGGAGDDMIYGQGGNDILTGGEGADHLDGGAGTDRADYLNSAAGVTVSLATGTGTGGDAEGDTLIGIENVSGSNFGDVLEGDDGTNRLVGRQGNDVLRGGGSSDYLLGGSGADVLDGGAGADTADYSGSWEGVVVDLLNNAGQGGEARGDTFVSIENVFGSEHADTISGDDGVNRLNGQLGDDRLFGNGGNDYLIGGLGNDRQNGGAGADVFMFEPGQFGNDTIEDFWAGGGRTDRVLLQGQGVDSFADLMANHAADTGEGVLIACDGGTILLQGVTLAQLSADDFIFG